MEKFFREIGSVFTELGEPRILLGAVLFVPAFFILYPGQWAIIAQAVVLAALVLYKHRSNIRRLLKGEENKLSFHKKQKS